MVSGKSILNNYIRRFAGPIGGVFLPDGNRRLLTAALHVKYDHNAGFVLRVTLNNLQNKPSGQMSVMYLCCIDDETAQLHYTVTTKVTTLELNNTSHSAYVAYVNNPQQAGTSKEQCFQKSAVPGRVIEVWVVLCECV